MKKTTILMLGLILLLYLTACGAKGSASDQNSTAPEHRRLEGYYLRGSEGQDLFLEADGTPIVLTNATGNSAVFDALENGDAIVITTDSIMETYPARASCFTCEKTADGNLQDLPADTLRSLVSLGWLDAVLFPAQADDSSAPEADPAELCPEVLGISDEEAAALAADGAARFVCESDAFRNHTRISLSARVTELTPWKLSAEITEDGTLRLTEETALGVLDEFGPEDVCVISGDLGEVVPRLGLSFRLADGTLQHYYLSISGENGDTLITAY